METYLAECSQRLEEKQKELQSCEEELHTLQAETSSLQDTIDKQELSPEDVLRIKRGEHSHSPHTLLTPSSHSPDTLLTLSSHSPLTLLTLSSYKARFSELPQCSHIL